MTAASLGTQLSLKTLDGEEKIEVKAGTQSGTVVRVRGSGVPHLRGAGRGDLHVHLEVKTPIRLTPSRNSSSASCARRAARYT